jgi:enamine deaminase RidA (YjgF/YER057c/UK114 family)
MSKKKVILTDRLMRPIAHFSHASRVGDLVHIGAVAGVFPDLRLAGESIGRIDVAAQIDRMFENLATELELMGARLSDVVRLKTYVAFPREIEKYNEVYARHFSRIKPAHTVIGSWDFPLPQAAIELDAIAVINGRAEVLEAEVLPLLPASAAAGVLCRGFHYATALPVDAEGRAASQADRRQTIASLENLEKMLVAAGLARKDVCSIHVTLADLRDLPLVEDQFRQFFGEVLPTCTIVGAALEKPDYRITVESIATRGGGQRVGSKAAPLVAGKPAPAVLAGDMLFLGGQLGLGEGQVEPGDVESQTRTAWDRLNSLIDTVGFTPDSIVRTNNILTDWRDYAGFNAGYGANMPEPYVPRATVLGKLSDTRAKVQVEGIAHRNGDDATILQVPPIMRR